MGWELEPLEVCLLLSRNIKKYILCYDSKEDTLFIALIFSLLRDGGELSLMKGDNNLGGINLPRLWLLFFRNVNTYRVTS